MQFTTYNPIWRNFTYPAKLQHAAKWQTYDISHLCHIFQYGKLIPFDTLQDCYKLPRNMLFYFYQLQRMVKARGHLYCGVCPLSYF